MSTVSGHVTLKGKVRLQLATLDKAGIVKPCTVRVEDITKVEASAVVVQQETDVLLPSTSASAMAIAGECSGSDQPKAEGEERLYFFPPVSNSRSGMV